MEAQTDRKNGAGKKQLNLGYLCFGWKSNCELKEDEEEEEEVDQVTYNSNGTACASSNSDSSRALRDSKQLRVGPISYSVW
jgi:hypothetical protein